VSAAFSSGVTERLQESAYRIGQRVQLEGCENEFIVVNVDDQTGRLELLQLRPTGRIENVPIHAIRPRTDGGPQLVSGPRKK